MKSGNIYRFLNVSFRYFAGFMVLLLLFFLLKYSITKKYEPENRVKTVLNTLQSINSQYIIHSQRLYKFLRQKNHPTFIQLNRYTSHFQEDILIFEKDSLIYWNSNHFPAVELSSLKTGKSKILFSGEKPFFAFKSVNHEFSFVAFFPLDKTNLPYAIKIEKGLHAGKNEFPETKYHVTIKVMTNPVPPAWTILLFFLYSFSILFAAIFLYRLYKTLLKKFSKQFPLLFLFSYSVIVVILRLLQIRTGFPDIFKNTLWTTTKITGVTGFVTPADLFINSILLGFLFLLFISILKEKKKPWHKKVVWPGLLLTQTGLLLLPVLLYNITDSIFQNSGMIFYPDNVYFSTTGFFRLILLFFINLITYVWVSSFIDFYRKKSISFYQVILTLSGVGLLFGIAVPSQKMNILLAYFVVVLLSSILWYVQRASKPYLHSILSIFILSLSAAYFLHVNEIENRNAHQQFTANILTQKRDPYLQYLIKSNAVNILNDTAIIKIIRSNAADKETKVANRINKKYFHGLLSAYRKQVTICEPGQKLEIQPENKVIGCNAFFKGLKGITVDSLQGFELSLVNNTNESIYYIAKFRYNENKTGLYPVNLYIEFYTNIIPKGLGYPELLKGKETGNLHLSGYSFAFYQQKKLEYKFGDYPFPIDFSDFSNIPEKQFFIKNGFVHYMLPVSKTEILIVSRPERTVSDWLLPFSLLFILSGVFMLVYVIFKYGKQIRETFRYSFGTRLQFTLFATLIVVYGLLTVIIIYYFNINNRQTISNSMKEKTHSVSIELQQKLSSIGNDINDNKMEIQSYLQKISMVFFSDINLYGNTGRLVVSSRPEIFNRGLQSKMMNPKAFLEIVKKHKLFFLGKEKIKHISFFSSYSPLILDNGETAGIINLPYFARQSELQHTYYQMLANLINLFVITGMLGMLLMIYLSRLLTKPLNILQQKIGSVGIEKQNETIEWKRQDEIGKLIEAYNQMVKKLEDSARLLKDSAREKAWREMARQIAHEIRNPLTPMKLNVQYLQKVYEAKDPAFDEKFKTVSQSLINQIETLNEVVNMFADFSKTSRSVTETSDIVEALRSATTFFKKSYALNIEFLPPEKPIYVKASIQDLTRIFNNLMKNAVQSMQNNKEKKIDIQVKQSGTYAEVRITDNGKGISNKDKEHIFQPYFTTKSKGTGLGLAIVKNLITEAGGKIGFMSEPGRGTTFILQFPLATGNKL